MPHRIEITDKTYDRLKEYCELNGLKIGQCADKLIFDGLMIEMYGDVPFTTYRVKPQEPVETVVVEGVLTKEGEFKQEKIKAQTPEEFRQEYLQDPGPMTDELRKKYDEFNEVERMNRRDKEIKEEAEKFKQSIEEAKKQGEETLKQAGVPTKVINKITRRRLK